MSKAIIIYLAAFAVCAFNNCLAGDLQDASQPANILEANVGKEFVITLESNKTTGYEWRLAVPPDKSILEFVRSEYRPGPANLIGAGGTEAWTFKALKKGEVKVSFEYVRPWEKNTVAAKREDFAIIVH